MSVQVRIQFSQQKSSAQKPRRRIRSYSADFFAIEQLQNRLLQCVVIHVKLRDVFLADLRFPRRRWQNRQLALLYAFEETAQLLHRTVRAQPLSQRNQRVRSKLHCVAGGRLSFQASQAARKNCSCRAIRLWFVPSETICRART